MSAVSAVNARGEFWYKLYTDRLDASGLIALLTHFLRRHPGRVYDPSTSQVYEVPVGWYTSYDIDRGEYTMSNLQPLPQDDHALWMPAAADGSAIH